VEQLRARVTPKQATPYFVDKLTQLSLFLERRLAQSDTPLQQSFNVARDKAYFKTVFFSGDRPGTDSLSFSLKIVSDYLACVHR